MVVVRKTVPAEPDSTDSADPFFRGHSALVAEWPDIRSEGHFPCGESIRIVGPPLALNDVPGQKVPDCVGPGILDYSCVFEFDLRGVSPTRDLPFPRNQLPLFLKSVD